MSKNRNYIDLLPDEILGMIFDRLKLKHAKNASLTCKRWYGIIFESGYIDRFKLNISILDNQFLPRPRRPEWPQLLVLAKQVVKRTERPYRSLKIGIEPLITGRFRTFWKFIHPKITQNLRVLNFFFIEGSMGNIFPFIIDAVPLMSQLKSFSASGYCNDSPYTKSIPTIRSTSIEHLVMEGKYKFAVDMPQLQTFSGALNALQSPATNSQSTVFANLRHLKIHVKGWKSTDLSVFGRMPCLETLDWGVIIPDRLFATLRDICPSLIEFRFPKSLYLYDMAILKPLFTVAQLRRLFLHNVVMYRTVDPVLDFSKLTQLEELDLGKTIVQPTQLRNLPKSIRKLGLHLDPNMDVAFMLLKLGKKYEQNLIDFIVSNLTELTELRIQYDETPPTEYFLKHLPLLEHLEVLQFSFCKFKRSFFLGMDTSLHRLHTLRFVKCGFETKHLLEQQEKFPSLKKRKFLDCFFANKPRYSNSMHSVRYYDMVNDSNADADEPNEESNADPVRDEFVNSDDDQSDIEFDDSMENESNADADPVGDEYDDSDDDQSDIELDDLKENESNADADPVSGEFDDFEENPSDIELDDSMETDSYSDADSEYDDGDYHGDEYDYYDFIESALFLDTATMSS